MSNALTIQEMKRHTRVGITTKELDEIGAASLERYGAVSAPKKVYNFPGHTCINVNNDVAHGIPSNRKIKPGDLVNIDVSAELGGYYADAGQSFQVPPYDTSLVRLCEYTHNTMMKVISSLKHGVKLNEIGRMIQLYATVGGYNVVQNLCSHGVGKSLHDAPTEILPIFNKHDKRVLKEGLLLRSNLSYLQERDTLLNSQTDGLYVYQAAALRHNTNTR